MLRDSLCGDVGVDRAAPSSNRHRQAVRAWQVSGFNVVTRRRDDVPVGSASEEWA